MLFEIRNNPQVVLDKLLENDPFVKTFATLDHDKIDDYFEQNVKTAADVSFILKKIMKILYILLKFRMIKAKNDRDEYQKHIKKRLSAE